MPSDDLRDRHYQAETENLLALDSKFLLGTGGSDPIVVQLGDLNSNPKREF